MPLSVMNDVSPDPVDVRLLSSRTQIARADGATHLIEELRRLRTGVVGQGRVYAVVQISPADPPDLAGIRPDGRGHLGKRPLLVEQLQHPDPLPRARRHRAPLARLVGKELAIPGAQMEAREARTSG